MKYIKHAQSLTLDQWRTEIWGSDPLGGPVFKAFEREVISFLKRPPISGFVTKLHLDIEEVPYFRWITHGVTVSEDFCSFPTTVYFYCDTEKYAMGETEIQPLEECVLMAEHKEGEERETYLLRVEAQLLINDDAQVSSKIIECVPESDPFAYELNPDNHEGCLLSTTGGMEPRSTPGWS